MSLQNLAQYLAAHGRGNDKMLMHVTPNEVAGLQSIAMAAGGSLSVNPETGLPEAGFFDFLGNIFPQIAGTAIGAAVGGPYGAAIGAGTAGAIETARSGNLLSGIMAGLGAYGGANLFQGVSNTGANVASAANAAKTPSVSTALQGAGTSVTNVPVPYMEAADALGKTTSFVPEAVSGIGGMGAADTTGALFNMTNKAPITFENLKAGFQNITGEGGLKSLQAGLGEAGKPITGGQLAARAALPIAQAAMSAMPGPEPLTDDTSSLWGKYTPLSEFRKRYRGYAQGGVLEQNPMMDDTSRQNLNLDMREHPFGEMNGLTGNYAKGGYLDGPGDGMSDDIPATIEGKQPARLADGEFVVPADVVSHLGNGSTKAGAKRLYEMMARVRKARTGNEKQGKQINPNKFVPA